MDNKKNKYLLSPLELYKVFMFATFTNIGVELIITQNIIKKIKIEGFGFIKCFKSIS